MKIDAVIFISFGGPEKQEDIRPFLEIVTQGRGIPKERLEDVAHHYERMGGHSPINEMTRRQAVALEKALAEQGTPWPVYIGQRNWHPFIEDTLRKMMAEGIHQAVGFITAAHRCEASFERYIHAVESARSTIGPQAPVIDYVHPWFDHPLFIEAICARVSECARPSSAAWMFTAHSIPTPMAEASRYVQELRETATAVCRRLGQTEWTLAYTSRSGRPADPWLAPDVCDLIQAQAKKGARDIFLIPIGFVSDHVEVLYDLDVEARDAARKTGVHLFRAQTVGDHPLFIRMIADVIGQRARQDLSPATHAPR